MPRVALGSRLKWLQALSAKAFWAWPLGVLLLGAAVTQAWVASSQHSAKAQRQDHFDRQTERVVGEAQRRLNLAVYGMGGLRATFAALPSLNTQQFTQAVRARDLTREFPGVSAFGFVDVEGLAQANQVSLAGVAPDQLRRVSAVEPLEQHAALLGLDLLADPASRSALLAAVQSGQPTLSGRLALLQALPKPADFLYLLPLYRAAGKGEAPQLRGVLFAVIVAKDALSGVLPSVDHQLDFEVFDGEVDVANLLFDLDGHFAALLASAPAAAPLHVLGNAYAGRSFINTKALHIGGRNLYLRTSSTASFDAAYANQQPRVLVASGAALTLLCTVCTWLLVASRRRVLASASALSVELDFLAKVARHTSSAVVVTDPERRIQWVNDAFSRATGYSREEVLGRTPSDLFSTVAVEPERVNAMVAAIQSGQPHHTRLHSHTQRGHSYWADIEIQPLRDEQGRLTGFMQIEHDVTATQEAMAALALERMRLATLLEATNAGVLEWDLKTDQLVLNERGAAMIGYTVAELSPVTMASWMARTHPQDAEIATQAMLRHIQGLTDSFTGEYRVRHKAGHWVWMLAHARVTQHNSAGRPLQLAGAHLDITAQKEAEQRWQARAQMSGDWFWQTDAEHRFYETDAGAEFHTPGLLTRLMGKRRDEATEFDPPEGGWAAFHERLDRHETFKGLVYCSHADPTKEQWLEVDGRPRFGADGAFVGYEGVGRRITERRNATLALQNSLALVDALFDTIPMPVALKDTQAQYVRVNKAFTEMMGVPVDKLLGQTSGALLDTDAARLHASVDFALLSHPGRQTYEARQTLPGKRVMDTLIHKATLQAADGSIAGLVATVVDISAQRDAVRATLEAKEAAESANAAKSAFLATMSHEIRTPMNGVLGMAELLAHSQLDAEQGQLVHTVRESALSLLRIIDDILDFSKVEAGRMELEQLPLDVTPLVEGVCTALAPMALSRGVLLQVQLAADVSERVVGDAGRLRQVLNNLVGNAIKFSTPSDANASDDSASSGKTSQPAGRVALRVSMYTPDPGGDERMGDSADAGDQNTNDQNTNDKKANAQTQWLKFEVQDNGVGMDSATLGRLFTPFTQAEVSTRRRFGGTGLGLAISRRLVELMGGRIDVTSQLGHGATFSVTLPLAATAMQPVQAAVDLRDLQCCIVADGNLPAHDLQAWLQAAGADVRLLAPGEPVHSGKASASQGPVVVVRADSAIANDADTHTATDTQPLGADTADTADGAAATDLRQLLIRRGRRGPARVVSPTAATLDLLCKGPFLRAVAMLAGRASPEPEMGALQDVTQGERVAPPSAEQARLRGQLILVAEDDPINRAVVQRQLALLGFAAEIAEDGAQALRMWRTGRYALLLSDLHMPQLDGYALAEAIRAAEQASVPALPRLPIVALTANALKGEALRARASGMDDYLTKPVPLKLLQSALQQWLPAPISPAPNGPQPAAANAQDVQQQQNTEGDLLPPTAVLDVQQLRDLVGDDNDTVRELLQDYAHTAALHTAELRQALAAADRALAAAVAHKLKSASRSVGAIALADVCEQIESRRSGLLPAAEAAAETTTEAAAYVAADAATGVDADPTCAACMAWLQTLDSVWLATQTQLQDTLAQASSGAEALQD